MQSIIKIIIPVIVFGWVSSVSATPIIPWGYYYEVPRSVKFMKSRRHIPKLFPKDGIVQRDEDQKLDPWLQEYIEKIRRKP